MINAEMIRKMRDCGYDAYLGVDASEIADVLEALAMRWLHTLPHCPVCCNGPAELEGPIEHDCPDSAWHGDYDLARAILGEEAKSD